MIAWIWQQSILVGKMLLYLICPPFCTNCRQPLDMRVALCIDCYQKIQPRVAIDVEITARCTLRVYAVGGYEGPLKKLILAKRYGDRVACYYMAQLIMQHIDLTLHTFDYILFIPLHWSRYAERGYNQAEEIAYSISKQLRVPVLPLLKRSKRTAFQSTFGKHERFNNVQDAFVYKPEIVAQQAIKDKRILLVDDLMTTGATLSAAAKTIMALKPAAMSAVVVARV